MAETSWEATAAVHVRDDEGLMLGGAWGRAGKDAFEGQGKAGVRPEGAESGYWRGGLDGD